MRMHVHNDRREPQFMVELSLQSPPAKVRDPRADGAGEIYLEWDQTVDDQGSLRRCPVCGCRDLYTRKVLPQVTIFVIIVFAVVVSLILLGFHQVVPALGALLLMLALDAWIYFFAPRKLICYRCRSEFYDLPIGKDRRPWNPGTGEKYPPSPTPRAS